jgi:glycosyltransferase involved in cell wall biosynthesis
MENDITSETTDRNASAEPVISVVIPCLNEEQSVGKCVEKALRGIEKTGMRGEVVVVDNASTDRSAEVAAAAGARVVSEPRRGYGSAYLKGFREARGRYFVMGDADLTYDFEEIDRFIKPLHEDGRDMVMGTRLKGDIQKGAMPWTHRWIGNPILSGMLKLFFRTSISDSHCGMRSFTRDAFDRMELRTTGMEFASEIVVKALERGLVIDEVPITYYVREGDSKLEGVRDAWRHVRFMLLFSPSYLFQLPGFLLLGVGAVLVLALGGGPREAFGRTWDYHVLLHGCLAMILGYNLLIMDLFAKSFSMSIGLVREGHWRPRLFGVFSLERGLVIAGILVLTGLGLEIKILIDWARFGYGELMAVRGIVLGITSIVLGMQTFFASFVLSLVQIPRE